MRRLLSTLAKSRKEKLPIVDKDGNLAGLITIKDIEKQIKYPLAAKDSQGRLLCGAAVGVTANILDRVAALVEKHVDCIVIDTAHGHSANVLKVVKMVRDAYPDLQIIAGNVATGAATEALIKAGVDCVKIGIGFQTPSVHLLQELAYHRLQQSWMLMKLQRNMIFLLLQTAVSNIQEI